MIRHWKDCFIPGLHAAYFTDVSGGKGYIGVTNVYGIFNFVQIHDNCIVRDMAILEDTAYFCGETLTGKALLGWVDLTGYLYSTSLNIDTATFLLITPSMHSIDNIEAYYDHLGRTCVVGYGKSPADHIGFEYILAGGIPSVTYGVLPYIPCDLTLTENFVVFAGTTGSGCHIIIHPFKKATTFTTPYVPYYSYAVCSATETEPYGYRMRVTDIGNDQVALLNYREGVGVYYMMLRKFNVTNAFYGYNLPMLTACQTTFNYSVTSNDVFDFLYDANTSIFLVLQNYEVTPSDYHDVVTKINFINGIPSTVQSDYLAIPDQPMQSMSLSDSSMYVVYGYNSPGHDQVFWKDKNLAPVLVPCLNSDVLPMNDFPIVSNLRHDCHYGTPLIPGSPYSTSSLIGVNKTIILSCH